MKNITAKKYSRISNLYDIIEYPIEKFLLQKYREKVISRAQGKILEIGVGTGKNLPYYSRNSELTAIDFSSGMLEIAQRKQKRLNLNHFNLLEMDVQKLSFQDNTFDTIVSTCVFCTVPEPEAGLKELYRVLKPGGKALFLEHMKSNWFIINIHLYLMNVFTKIILGTSMIRETQRNIEKSGFKIISVENLKLDILRFIIATK
jgi:ubiquinone/menaquinone biosynthesis C-methylase UbiE